MVGGTGYIGRHVVHELVARGHEVVCLIRRRRGDRPGTEGATLQALAGATIRFGDVTDAASVLRDGLCGEAIDAVVSCLASRSGGAEDARRIDRDANLHVLAASKAAGARHFVLLSAICVQKPRLAFQYAKLAFEKALVDSGLDYSIVRPTAFFKSLSGQIERVRRGKPFLMFGDGTMTACKPIAEGDLARFIAECLEDEGKRNRILPVGGPGAAITPAEQAALLFELCGRRPRIRHVPLGMLDVIVSVLTFLGRVAPGLQDKAELARIGRYYATESMLVRDPATGRYDADATPSFGTETLREFYGRVLENGLAGQELGAQAVFSRGDEGPRKPLTLT